MQASNEFKHMLPCLQPQPVMSLLRRMAVDQMVVALTAHLTKLTLYEVHKRWTGYQHLFWQEQSTALRKIWTFEVPVQYYTKYNEHEALFLPIVRGGCNMSHYCCSLCGVCRTAGYTYW